MFDCLVWERAHAHWVQVEIMHKWCERVNILACWIYWMFDSQCLHCNWTDLLTQGWRQRGLLACRPGSFCSQGEQEDESVCLWLTDGLWNMEMEACGNCFWYCSLHASLTYTKFSSLGMPHQMLLHCPFIPPCMTESIHFNLSTATHQMHILNTNQCQTKQVHELRV